MPWIRKPKRSLDGIGSDNQEKRPKTIIVKLPPDSLLSRAEFDQVAESIEGVSCGWKRPEGNKAQEPSVEKQSTEGEKRMPEPIIPPQLTRMECLAVHWVLAAMKGRAQSGEPANELIELAMSEVLEIASQLGRRVRR